MRKWMGMLAAIVLLSLLPSRGKELGGLLPIALIEVTKPEEQIVVRTEKGPWGRGLTLQEAIHDLQEHSAENVLLETIEYLLIDEECSDVITEANELLRPSIKVCRIGTSLDLEKTIVWLSTHKPEITIEKTANGERAQKLVAHEGRYFYEKDER